MNDATRARFWAKVKKSDGCWLWTGAIGTPGYGLFWLDGKQVTAHRVAFYLEHGRWPDPCALHGCDNPPCVRVGPGHIFEGTKANNSADMKSKGRGRGPARKTHCQAGHALEGKNVRMNSLGYRYCYECQKRFHREYLQRLKMKAAV